MLDSVQWGYGRIMPVIEQNGKGEVVCIWDKKLPILIAIPASVAICF
jgi:hypothetical protein